MSKRKPLDKINDWVNETKQQKREKALAVLEKAKEVNKDKPIKYLIKKGY